MKKSAAPVHSMSSYSLLKGILSPHEICFWASKQGYPYIGIADCNGFYGLPAFLDAASHWGLKAVPGVQIWQGNVHICSFYPHNRTGLGLLFVLLSRIDAYNLTAPEFHGDNRILKEVYQFLKAGWSDFSVILFSQDYLKDFSAIQKSNLYMGLSYGMPYFTLYKQARNAGIRSLPMNRGVITDIQDVTACRVLRSIGENCSPEQLPPALQVHKHNILPDYQAFNSYFDSLPDVYDNLQDLVSRIDFSHVHKAGFVFPDFDGRTDAESLHLLRSHCLEGIKKRFPHRRDQALKRLDYELSIIGKKGFAAYFLVVHDIVKRFSRTCGRGSSAASIVSYLLEITQVDPIAHNLYFERFLHMGRKDPPDIDVDFAWDEREGALDYVFNRYSGRAAMVADHITFARKSAIREPARILGFDDEMLGIFSLNYVRGNFDQLPPHLFQIAERIKGLPRHLGTHPGGIVITPGPITDYTHVHPAPPDRLVMAWEKDGCEDMGLVKIDLLGNRSLGVLRDCVELISKRRKRSINWDETPAIEDPETRRFVESGETSGIFYIESPATRQLLKKMGTADFEHLVMASSIIRPAANKYAKLFVQRIRREPSPPVNPLVRTILQETYGLMIYQEDVARVAVELADFSPEEGDVLRKTLSRKDRNLKLPAFKERFMQAAGGKNRSSREDFEALWKMILSFAGYSFCKSHSASYALVSYKLAFLKHYYPLEFYVSVINNGGGFYSRKFYVREVMRLGYTVYGPDVNRSDVWYTIEDDGMRIGLAQLPDLSKQCIGRVIESRYLEGPFTGMHDFLQRVSPNFSEARVLIRSGALDSIACDNNRPQLFWLFYHHGDLRQKELISTEILPPLIQDYSPITKYLDERQYVGLHYSRHPLEILKARIQQLSDSMPRCPLIDSRSVSEYKGCYVLIAGAVIAGKEVWTKKGKDMAFLSFDDSFGIFETTLFPVVYEEASVLLDSSEYLMVYGLVEEDHSAYSITVKKLFSLEKKSSACRNSRQPLH